MKNYNTEDTIFALATGFVKSAIAVVRVSGEGCVKGIEPYFESRKPLSNYATNTAVYGTLKQIAAFDGLRGSNTVKCLTKTGAGTVSIHNEDGDGSTQGGAASASIQNGGSRGLTCVSSGIKQTAAIDVIIDNCIITIYKDGHGYTGEEALEISLHGSPDTIKTTLHFLSSIGFRQAERGEFTLRAFLHHKMDLTQAEAVNELINSETSKARKASLSRLNGSLLNKIEEIKLKVLEIMSIIEVQLDYSEDEIGENLDFPEDKISVVIGMLKKISGTYSTGRLYKDGAKIVLAGVPNAGKSSLFNLFLKEDRAIVSPIKGTTRDYIESACSINGIPIRLYDTAGLRDAESVIEEEGVKKSYSLMEEADVILYLVDATNPELENDILKDKRCIPLLNKTDLQTLAMDGFTNISVKTGEGFDALLSRIEAKIKEGIDNPADEAIVIESTRQRDNLNVAISSLEAAISHSKMDLPIDIVSIDIQEALNALAELTGEVATDDILDKIFSSFCVGK